MKTLNIPLEDKQYKLLNCAKLDYEADKELSVSWKEFLLILLKSYEGEK